MKEIEIDMVLNVPDTETRDTIMDKFLEWVAANGWKAGGVVEDMTGKELRKGCI